MINDIQFPLELNGFSNYITGETTERFLSDFTISISFTPYTYESCESGLLSALNMEEKEGFAISIGKGGIVNVYLGIQSLVRKFSNLTEKIQYNKKNLVTVSFWGTAGWCDLCINGKLANRIQLPRHSSLPIPKGNCFIGKYMEKTADDKNIRKGVFHGRIQNIVWEERYLPFQSVIKLQQEELQNHGQAGKGLHPQLQQEKISLYAHTDAKKDRYRPVFHLMPPAKWMNEPHAPFFYKERYHIFYQANPHAPVWDNLSWGHLTSRDMVIWQDVGIALSPDVGADYDKDGCWSGSACLDENGTPHLFYTAGNNDMLPNQAVAMAVPQNTDDKKLLEWKKCGIILTQGFDEGFLGEYRDPFVFRRGSKYYFLVGSGDASNGGGNALVYSTKDFQTFERHGFLMDYDYESCPEVGHVWELPVLLPLHDENGQYFCDILLFCACQVENEVVETYYFLGKFSEEKMIFEKYQDTPALFDFGNGTFTGPSGFVTTDGRSIVFTIAQGKRNPADEYASGWAHNGGIPIELSVRNGSLKFKPVREMQKYFSTPVSKSSLLSGKSLLLENKILLETKENSLTFRLKTDEDTLVFSYHRETEKFEAKSEHSGKVLSKYRNAQDKVHLQDDFIEMEIYIDHSMIEVYLNKQKSITLRNYSYQSGYHLELTDNSSVTAKVWNFER